MSNKYELRYLPLFYTDLENIINYMIYDLHNRSAANNFLNSVELAIVNRQYNAESFEKMQLTSKDGYPYYRIYVKNYTIYYVVINHNIMEVRRILYNKQDRD